MDKILLMDIEKCTGCGRCTLACSGAKEGTFVPSKSRIHFVNFARVGLSVPNICFHCEDPKCASSCPEDALIWNNDIGAVVVDNDICTGCALCLEACPYGMIELGTEGLAYKCDLCLGDPECVKVCEPGSIVFDVPDQDSKNERLYQMSKKITQGEPSNKRLAIAEIFRKHYR